MLIFGAMSGAGSMGTMMTAGFLLLMIGLIILVITLILCIHRLRAFCPDRQHARSVPDLCAYRHDPGHRLGCIQPRPSSSWGVLLVLFGLIISLLALIPLVGWLIQIILQPLVQIFSARYIARVYDHGVPQAPAPAPEPAVVG
jgi:hypothetical protein